MLTETSVTTTLELLTIIVELVATFSIHLTTNHVVEIIEMCHGQIKSYVMSQSRGTNFNSSGTFSNATSRMKNSTLISAVTSGFSATFSGSLTPKVSIEDKVLSAIYLTGGQVCHHFTKHRMGVGGSLKSSGRRSTSKDTSQTSVSSSTSTSGVLQISEQSTSGRATTDLIYLLLYLSKKLECKLGFYRDFQQQQQSGDHHGKGLSSNFSPEEQQQAQTKGELFLLMKIYNCFYLKCLQYTLLTIPDAWRYMTTHIMEIVW